MSDRIELYIGGRVYSGWKSATVTSAMDASAGAFALEVAEKWEPRGEPWPINPGDACEIKVGGEVVITGYVDVVRPSYSSASHGIQVQGRDRSADLIDCSAIHRPDQWKSITLTRLAEILAAPFGVPVRAEADVGRPLELVKLQHGETVMEALQRYAKMRKVLVMPDGRGGILLTRTGQRRAAVQLVQGQNILSATGTLDWSERYSDYLIKGQAGYRSATDGKAEAHATGAAKDKYVSRYRPLLVVSDAETSSAAAKDRATWEANTRLGKSAEAQVVVQGWRQSPGGALWQPNMLVQVTSSWLRLDGEMIIRQVSFGKDDSGGTTTRLDVVSPQSFEPEPPDGQKGKRMKRQGKATGDGNDWGATTGESK